jgi:DNA-directed RNA polymerase subunit RPC12/RpoP
MDGRANDWRRVVDDSDFAFLRCPECGSGMLEETGIIAMSGKIRCCLNCGKEWHVIWENAEDWEEDD